jgi:hypothetical protein
MAHRNSLMPAALTTLGLSLLLAACAGTASPSAPAGGSVAGATAAGSSPAASVEEPSASAPGASGSGAAASESLTVQDEAEVAACDAVQAWSDSMQELVAMDPAVASTDDVQAQVEKIRTAWEDVKASLENVDAADEDAVRDAAESLESSIDDFNTDVPVADAIEEIKTAGQPLRDVYRNMADGLGCELVDPY